MNLYPYQEVGRDFLRSRRKAILADAPGLGKTRQVLAAIEPRVPAVVVCPAVAKGVWLRETLALRPDIKPVIVDRFRWPERGELVIINYERLPLPPGHMETKAEAKRVSRDPWAVLTGERPPQVIQAWKGAPERLLFAVDEAHALSNLSTVRYSAWELMKNTALDPDCKGTVWLATGTPLLSRATQLRAFLKAANLLRQAYDHRFGELFGQQLIALPNGRTFYKWKTPPPEYQEERVEGFKRVALRREREEVLDLPPRVFSDVEVELDEESGAACDELSAWLDAQGMTVADLVNDDTKIQFPHMSTLRALLASAKIPFALEYAAGFEDAGEPLVVFSAHTAVVEAFKGRKGWAVITGETLAKKRTAIEEQFQAGKLRGIAATIQAAGVALTLHRAAHCLFVDLDWTPELNNQAADRIYRIGQLRGVTVTRLIGNHVIDDHLLRVLYRKEELIASFIPKAQPKPGGTT